MITCSQDAGSNHGSENDENGGDPPMLLEVLAPPPRTNTNEELTAVAGNTTNDHQDSNAVTDGQVQVLQHTDSANETAVSDDESPISNTTTALTEWSTRTLMTAVVASCATNQQTSSMTAQASNNDDTAASSNNNKSRYYLLCVTARRARIAIAVAVLLLATAIVALVIPFTKKKNDIPNQMDVTMTMNDIARVRTFLLEQNWSDPLTFMDPVSPQTRAVYQLAMEDYDTLTLDGSIQQRYAFLVVWFGLGGGGTTTVPMLKECQWHEFVQCNAKEQVVNMTIDNQGFSGTISPEISMLSHLEVISLFENHIQGQFPTTLYSLTKLSTLELSGNDISSELSEDIGQLTNLENLNLGGNGLFGPLPTSLQSLTNLKTVYLFRTQLEGPIVEYAVAWPNLELLSVGGNEKFHGTIPSEIGTLSRLETLIIQITSIRGTLPTEIGNLSNLAQFQLGHPLLADDSVSIHGPLPSEIGNCRKLEALLLEASKMSGTLPSTLGKLSSALAKLLIRSSHFSGTIPDSLANLNKLHSAQFDGNALTGTLPEWLGTLENLRLLSVFWNSFTGSVPMNLCRATLRFYYDCHQSCDCCGACGPVV